MARNEALARIIHPIVEGQVRAYLHAHPEGEAHPGQLATGIGKRAYDSKARELHGEFACTNFNEEGN
jgi:hypothetical protein